MGSLLSAYVGAWLAMAAYLGWMARRNVRLAQRLDELEAALKDRRDRERVQGKAA
jgi:hypothetical protein